MAGVNLTDREKAVLSAVAEGKTSKKVAEESFCSKRTIDFHLMNIYEKLDADNRIQAINKALQFGLI